LVPPVTETLSTADFQTAAYHYALPPELIATRPPAQRDEARLLVMEREGGSPLVHARFGDLGRFLRAGDCLVVNETRVIKARLLGRRSDTGGRVELLVIGPVASGEDGVWEAIGRPGKRLLPGTHLEFEAGAITGEIVGMVAGGRRQVRLESAGSLADVIEAIGHVPIPPYLGRRDDARDREDYQTVYARVPGGVAAPTAGLHFTPELLRTLEASGVEVARIVLHPGPGTFRPVAVPDVRSHRLDSEPFHVPAAAAEAITRARQGGGRVVAVGTTVVRTLETQARAARAAGSPALVLAGEGRSELFIHPPYAFSAVDALITNFHLPQSTLLMLVAAFAGRERVLAAYAEAIRQGYLFYSYGDAMLVH
jgi:S-adenosylmethionine:tRNA ribosyltransferase-isomerase